MPGGRPAGLNAPARARRESQEDVSGVVDRNLEEFRTVAQRPHRDHGVEARKYRRNVSGEIPGKVDHVRPDVADASRAGASLVKPPTNRLFGVECVFNEVPAAESRNGAYVTCLDESLGEHDRGPFSKDEVDLAPYTRLRDRFVHALSRSEGVRQGLFAENKLTVLSGVDRNLGMHVVWSDNVDDVDVLCAGNGPPIVAGTLPAVTFCSFISETLECVDNPDEFYAGKRRPMNRGKVPVSEAVCLPHEATTDEPNPYDISHSKRIRNAAAVRADD